MVKEGRYSKGKIEKSLNLTDKYLKGGKPLSASRALTVALNHARFYEGPDKNNYLERIKQQALSLGQDRTLEDYEYEHVQGIEEQADMLQTRKSGIEGLLPAIIGGLD